VEWTGAAWRRLSKRRSALVLLVSAAIAGSWLTAVFVLALQSGAPGDFSSFYCGAQILRSHGPAAVYDFTLMQECDAAHFPGHDVVLPFIRPPFYAAALTPFTLLPARSALLVWLAINAVALVWSVALLADATAQQLSDTAWHSAIFFPSLFTFFNRQDVPLVLLLASTGYVLLRRGRPFAAGAVLGFCTFKFHLMLLVPAVFLARNERRALAGLASSTGFLSLVSLGMLGGGGVVEYARLLLHREAPNIERHPERLVNLANLAGHKLGWEIVLTILVAGAVVVIGRRLPILPALSAGWLGSLLVAPHIFISDYLLALPACLLLPLTSRISMFASIFLLFPLVPILMRVKESLVLAAPLLALTCLLGALAQALRPGGVLPSPSPSIGEKVRSQVRR
jgi:hypothetical protein